MQNTSVLVLVADDNDGIRETTSMILKAAGYRVTEAIDGQDAVEKLKEQTFDVAVLDVRMPKRDGIWVVENAYPTPPPPGIIMASAYDFDQEMRTRLGTRVFRYLRKPVAPGQLLDTVRQAAHLGPPEGAH